MIFTQFQKIMKNSTAEAKVAAYKIARDLEGLSLGVAVKTLTTVLVADTIINGIKRVVENAEREVRNENN